jgi:hypothetical protein
MILNHFFRTATEEMRNDIELEVIAVGVYTKDSELRLQRILTIIRGDRI